MTKTPRTMTTTRTRERINDVGELSAVPRRSGLVACPLPRWRRRRQRRKRCRGVLSQSRNASRSARSVLSSKPSRRHREVTTTTTTTTSAGPPPRPALRGGQDSAAASPGGRARLEPLDRTSPPPEDRITFEVYLGSEQVPAPPARSRIRTVVAQAVLASGRRSQVPLQRAPVSDSSAHTESLRPDRA